MVSGLSGEELAAGAAKLGIPPADVPDAIAEARKRITIAADYDRDLEVGTAIIRLNDLYNRSIRDGDNRTALQAVKGLAKLLDLEGCAQRTEEAIAEAAAAPYVEQLNAIEEYIRPLYLVRPRRSLVDDVRVAAELIKKEQDRAGAIRQAASAGRV